MSIPTLNVCPTAGMAGTDSFTWSDGDVARSSAIPVGLETP